MDTGILRPNALNHLEFTNNGSHVIPLPDELPPAPDLHHLPKDILKSSTVENLISQNEDLMARLKVALRRLSAMELESQKVQSENEDLRRRTTVTQDQLLVMKEKDSAWREKAGTALKDRDFLAEKTRALEDRLTQTESELSRYQKYHEKIKTQVKPSIVQMKEYSRSLEARLAEFEKEASKHDALVRDLRAQIIEVSKNSRFQLEQQEIRSHELINSYETSLQQLQEERQQLTEANGELETKALRLRRTEQKADELENELVELRRSKEDLTRRFEQETRRLMDLNEEMNRENARSKIENEDLRARNEAGSKRLHELEKAHLDNQSQIESLRFMWQNVREENERLKISMAALERLNVDLSAKLQELRQRAQAASVGLPFENSSSL